ncbi:MAG: hypothetical protein JWN77_2580 [Frankiales bacterium]|jgi:transposase|nr:hypothetical protein [Frankiales bacterium]
MGRHRTPEEKVELGQVARRLRAEGRSRREIAAELHVGDDLLRELLAGTEVPASLRRHRAKDELRELARELYGQGRSYREIERELSVARSSLSLWLRDLKGAGLATPQQAEPAADERRARARALRSEGLLLTQIAGEVGVSAAAVRRWVRDLPVPPRARPGADVERLGQMRRLYWDRVLAERQEERAAVQDAAASCIPPMTPELVTLLATVAYWCEGSKSKPWRRQERLAFVNSDAGLVLLFLAFLRQEGVGDERLRLNVAIHESADVTAAER